MQLRPYQTDAVAACWQFLCQQAGNPVICLPTGAGKSLVIAQLCRDAVERFAGRVVVLAHRKELLEQNADKIRLLLPGIGVGLYSAGLRSRDTEDPVIVAGIQSVYKRAYDLGRRHLVLIDEVHLVPFDGEGMYRTFLNDLRSANDRLRMAGLTATPYRLDCGPMCRPDGLFQKVCYSAPIQQLIRDGYLCNLTTRPAATAVDTSQIRIRGGEFAASEAETVFSDRQLIADACREIIAKTPDRHSILIFCCGVHHANLVDGCVRQLTGEACGVITGDSLPIERQTVLDDFRNRRLRWLCNVDVLTTGFDAPCIDAIAILRATMSAGLFAQICGRGFRLHPSKSDCLVLDFGGNIDRHGPLDAIDYGRCKRTGDTPGEAPTKTCPNCQAEVYAGAAECECGWIFPPPDSRHQAAADEQEILSKPERWTVEDVSYNRHAKRNGGPDDPPTLRVDYQVRPIDSAGGNLDLKQISEWVCVEHEGFAGRKAVRWWRDRSLAPVPDTVDQAVDLARRGALAWPRSITTIKEGRWQRVLSAELEDRPTEWLDPCPVADDCGGFDAFEEDIPF